MPYIPPGIATVLLSGRYIRPDGTPLRGTVTFNAPTLTLSAADTITVGSAKVELDEDGAFSLTLIATDNTSMQPTDWTYKVRESFMHADGRSYAIVLPQATPVVDLADIAPADPSNGDYVLVTGPAGKNGTQIFSGVGAPTSVGGATGDFYFDLTPDALRVYGPRTVEGWPAAASALVGGTSFTVQGAAGNGTTDDIVPLQAAVDRCSAAGGGTVVFPPGRTYGIADYLYVPSNVTLYAYGATIKSIGRNGLVRLYRPGDSFTAFNGHSNIAILGGTWDANASDGTTGTVVDVIDAFTLGHNSDVTFRDVTVKNVSGAHALDVSASRHVRVINCRFLGFKDNTPDASRAFSEAIQLDSALASSGSIGANDNTVTQDVRVEGCYFGPSERLGPFGRAVGSHTTASGDFYDNVQVLGCRIEGAGQEGIRPYAWRRAVIDSNIISGTGTSSIVITGPDPAVTGYSITSHMITVSNNIVEAPVTNTPIRVIGFATARPTGVRIQGNTVVGAPATGIYVSQADRPSITDNTVIGSATSSVYAINCNAPQIAGNSSVGAVGTAVGIESCTGGSMTGNEIDGAASGTGHGCIVTNSTDVTVKTNRINAVRGSGVRVTGTSARCRIMNNTVIRGGVTALGVDVASTTTGCVVVGNDLTGGAWPTNTALSLLGTTMVLDYAGGSTAPGHNLVS